MQEITDYIDYIRANPKIHSHKTTQCIERVAALVKKIEVGELIYDAKEVRRIITFFNKLVADEAGTKIKLTKWQRFFLAAIFGIRDKDGNIILNDIFLFIAKKNGKTALIAGIALYYLITIKAAQVLLVATDYSQASIAFRMICGYVRNTPMLAEALDHGEIFIRESAPLAIAYYPGGAAIRIIPETRARQAQGFNPNFIMFDEISSYRTSEIMTKLASGQVKQNAIRASLTTAETNLQNPGRAEYDRATMVLDGKFTASNYFPLIYELDKKDDKWDETNYQKANPSLDIIKPLKKIIEDRDRAKQNPIEEAAFFAYQLNVWSANASTDISDDDWAPAIDNAEKYKSYLTPEKLKGYPCFGAFDLSKIDDYTAYTLYFFIKAINCFYALHRFYIPAAMLQLKTHLETEQVRIWERQGFITATRDNMGDRVINYDYLEHDVIKDAENYHMIGLTYDVAHASKFIERINQKVPTLATIPFQQGWKKISPANKQFLEIVYQKRLIDANPVMHWMIGCVKIYNDRIGNTYFEKINYRQSPLRIDGVDTSVMASAMLIEQIDQNEATPEEIAKIIASIDY